MDEQAILALVRDAVAQRLAALAADPPPAVHAAFVVHPSHALYLHLVNDSDACVIEPAVACNHCGYCKSHGH